LKDAVSNTNPLDQRLESHAKRLRNDRVCPVRDTCVTKRVDPETQNERVRVGSTQGRRALPHWNNFSGFPLKPEAHFRVSWRPL
jgi:hypothetical protein